MSGLELYNAIVLTTVVLAGIFTVTMMFVESATAKDLPRWVYFSNSIILFVLPAYLGLWLLVQIWIG